MVISCPSAHHWTNEPVIEITENVITITRAQLCPIRMKNAKDRVDEQDDAEPRSRPRSARPARPRRLGHALERRRRSPSPSCGQSSSDRCQHEHAPTGRAAAPARRRRPSTPDASCRGRPRPAAAAARQARTPAACRGASVMASPTATSSHVDDRQVAVGADACRRRRCGRDSRSRSPRGSSTGDPRIGGGHGRDDVVALDVGVGVDPVRDLQREQRQPDGGVERAGGEPVDARAAGQQPLVGALPEPHVVTLGGVAVDLLLVGEVLLAAEEEERTDRRLVVAAPGERGGDDPPRRAERDGIGLRPPAPPPSPRGSARASPRSARLTGSPSSPSLVRARPMK